MRRKLNLTELSNVELANVKAGAEGNCSDCAGDISYFADNIGDACDCSSIFNAIGLNLAAPQE